jgi:hypothetical protein
MLSHVTKVLLGMFPGFLVAIALASIAHIN